MECPHDELEILLLLVLTWPQIFMKLYVFFHKTNVHDEMKFEQTWLACCTKPMQVIDDTGQKFTGLVFSKLYRGWISTVANTTHIPQSNAICKQIHQSIEDILSCLAYSNLLGSRMMHWPLPSMPYVVKICFLMSFLDGALGQWCLVACKQKQKTYDQIKQKVLNFDNNIKGKIKLQPLDPLNP